MNNFHNKIYIYKNLPFFYAVIKLINSDKWINSAVLGCKLTYLSGNGTKKNVSIFTLPIRIYQVYKNWIKFEINFCTFYSGLSQMQEVDFSTIL